MAFNKELALKALAYIEANPSEWDQTKWRCGTSFCFAGHVVSQAYGKNLQYREVYDFECPLFELEGRLTSIPGEAQTLLGATQDEKAALFHASNTLEDLKAYVEAIADGRLKDCDSTIRQKRNDALYAAWDIEDEEVKGVENGI